jgi:hypothetical protein
MSIKRFKEDNFNKNNIPLDIELCPSNYPKDEWFKLTLKDQLEILQDEEN